MSTLGSLGEEVPEHVWVLQVGLRIPLLGVDEVGESHGISDEEDGGVVTSHVPVTFLGVELDGESSGITFRVSRTLLTAHCGPTAEDGGLLTNGLEWLGFGESGDVCSGLKVTESTFGLNNKYYLIHEHAQLSQEFFPDQKRQFYQSD